ncbi:MAG: AMP-binding protein [Flavobacteriales bacterium]|nr:AMP-binding protein [Flavobacteriales bacterium]
MSESVNIDGIAYDLDKLKSKWEAILSDVSSPEYQKDIWGFIKHWFDERDHIEVTTSGSTGSPSLKRIPKRWMSSSAKATAKALDLESSKRAFLCISTRHIGGMMMIVRSLEIGLSLITSAPVRKPIVDQKMDFTAMVPLQVKSILESGGSLLQFGTIIIGGAPMDSRTEKQLKSLETPIFSTFGMTETVSHIALRRLSGELATDVFETLPEVRVSSNAEGRAQVHIPYFDDLTLISNDHIEIIDPQHFLWIGRLDNVINSGGLKIYPESVEAKLADLVDQIFFIYKQTDSVFGEVSVLCLEGKSADEDQIKAAIRSIGDSKLRPKIVYLIEEFIRTETGKIQRALSFNQEKRRLF